MLELEGTASSATFSQFSSSTPYGTGRHRRPEHRPAQTQTCNRSRRLVVEASISRIKYLTEQASGPTCWPKNTFLAAGRQPVFQTHTYTCIPDSVATDKLNMEWLVCAAPVDCAGEGGALINCHLSVWLLGLGLSIITVITLNWIHCIICNETELPHHQPSLDS